MRVPAICCLLLALTLAACASSDQPREDVQSDVSPEAADSTPRIFYLHGRIVEDQGTGAVSPQFGPYDYAGILEALGSRGAEVISEVRQPDTDPALYADSIARQVQRMLGEGMSPDQITVVGASKGAIITMLVSDRVREPIRYVMLANCNPVVLENYPAQLHGRVLSIYEASDSLGGSCEELFDRSPELLQSSEIELDTGLEHGFLFQPLDGWVTPALNWAAAPSATTP